MRLTLTPAGRSLVEEVTTRRRSELNRIVADMPDQHHAAVIAALRAFATAAGEVPEQECSPRSATAPRTYPPATVEFSAIPPDARLMATPASSCTSLLAPESP